MSNTPLLAGIDGGGTRSELVLLNQDMQVVNRYSGPSLQVLRLSEQLIEENLSSLLKQCSRDEKKRITVLGAGLAGAHAEATQTRILPLLKNIFELPTDQIHLCSDVEAAHIGAFDNKNGIMAIMGTGSVALGRWQDTWKIVGGYGYKLGDEASGYDLGKLALQLASYHLDGNQSFPELINVLRSQVNPPSVLESRSHFIRWVYEEEPNFARFAPLFLELCSVYPKYQPYLKQRIKLFVESLQSLTSLFDAHSSSSIPVCLSGGLIQNELFKTTVIDHLGEHYPEMKMQHAIYDAATGAALAAKHQIN